MWLWVISWLKPTCRTSKGVTGKRAESHIPAALWPDRLNWRKSRKSDAFASEVGGSDPEHAAGTDWWEKKSLLIFPRQLSAGKSTFRVSVIWVWQNRSATAKRLGKFFRVRMMSGAGNAAKVIPMEEHRGWSILMGNTLLSLCFSGQPLWCFLACLCSQCSYLWPGTAWNLLKYPFNSIQSRDGLS